LKNTHTRTDVASGNVRATQATINGLRAAWFPQRWRRHVRKMCCKMGVVTW